MQSSCGVLTAKVVLNQEYIWDYLLAVTKDIHKKESNRHVLVTRTSTESLSQRPYACSFRPILPKLQIEGCQSTDVCTEKHWGHQHCPQTEPRQLPAFISAAEFICWVQLLQWNHLCFSASDCFRTCFSVGYVGFISRGWSFSSASSASSASWGEVRFKGSSCVRLWWGSRRLAAPSDEPSLAWCRVVT